MPDDSKDGKHLAPEESGGHPDETGAAYRKKLGIMVSALAVLVVGAGVIGTYVISGRHDEPGAVTIEIGGETEYVELPEILTHLAGGEESSNHTKLEIIIELPERHIEALQEQEPVIVDAIQSYLRGKTREELAGEAGAERLRGELLVMINQRIAPAEARDILFKTFLIN